MGSFIVTAAKLALGIGIIYGTIRAVDAIADSALSIDRKALVDGRTMHALTDEVIRLRKQLVTTQRQHGRNAHEIEELQTRLAELEARLA